MFIPYVLCLVLSILLVCAQGCLNDTTCTDCRLIPIGIDILGNLYVVYVCKECEQKRELNQDYECVCKDQYYIDQNMQCASCPENSVINSKRQCICNDGYFKTTNNTCSVCPVQCLTCTKDKCLQCTPNVYRTLQNGECLCAEGYQQKNGNLICSEKPNILMIALSSAGSVVCFFGSVIVCVCIRMRRRGQQVFQSKKNHRNSQNIEVQIYESYESSDPMENSSNMFWNAKNYEYLKDQQCSICLQTKTYFITECGHYFHSKCIYEWLEKRNTCPNCNKEITSKEIRRWCQKCLKVLMPVIRNVVIKRIGRNGNTKKQFVQSTPIEHQYCEQCDISESSQNPGSQFKNEQ